MDRVSVVLDVLPVEAYDCYAEDELEEAQDCLDQDLDRVSCCSIWGGTTGSGAGFVGGEDTHLDAGFGFVLVRVVELELGVDLESCSLCLGLGFLFFAFLCYRAEESEDGKVHEE